MYIVLSHYQVLADTLATDKTIAPHRSLCNLPYTTDHKLPMQVLLPILPSLQFKPPSLIMEDKISITPY